MGIFSAIEGAMRGVVEGTFRRLIPTHVQEQEVLDALRRVMTDHIENEDGRQIAPHRYAVRINQRDYQALVGRTPALDQQMALNLRRIASNEGYLLKGALVVTFQPDAVMSQGQVDVRVAPSAVAVPAGGLAPDATHTIMAPAPAPPPAPGQAPGQARPQPNISIPPAWLTLLRPAQGQPFKLDRPVITIGRHDTNDIVVNEKRVSRFHADIKYDHNAFVLQDLRSINGVYLNGARISGPVALKDRDVISVGGYEFIFQRR